MGIRTRGPRNQQWSRRRKFTRNCRPCFIGPWKTHFAHKKNVENVCLPLPRSMIKPSPQEGNRRRGIASPGEINHHLIYKSRWLKIFGPIIRHQIKSVPNAGKLSPAYPKLAMSKCGLRGEHLKHPYSNFIETMLEALTRLSSEDQH